MRVDVSTAEGRDALQGTFGETVKRGESAKDPGVSGKMGAAGDSGGFSSGGIVAPDGDTRNPFPASLAAYIDVLRSVAAYLREKSGGTAEGVAEKVTAVAEEIDVAEPTTFAVGEEDRGDCGSQHGGGTPAIGAPMPVEPDGGIGDGAGPIPIYRG